MKNKCLTCEHLQYHERTPKMWEKTLWELSKAIEKIEELQEKIEIMKRGREE